MLAANFALEFHELHKFRLGQYFEVNFFESAFSFNSVIVVQFNKMLVNFLF